MLLKIAGSETGGLPEIRGTAVSHRRSSSRSWRIFSDTGLKTGNGPGAFRPSRARPSAQACPRVTGRAAGRS
jgi:hypothetical protein